MDLDQTQNRRIIAFCGFEGSGKNAAAEYLCTQGFTSFSFAYNLKKAVAVIFGWKFELLEGLTHESRAWREQVDEFWAKELNIPGLTPRKVLQLIGTDVIRKHFCREIWILSLKRKLMSFSGDVVISDCRFPDEVDAIKAWGGTVMWIYRKSTIPHWLISYVSQKGNQTPEDFYRTHGVHPTETSLLDYDLKSIDNNGSIEDLQRELSKFLETHL